MKQYVTTTAYSGNTRITTVVDGAIEGDRIVPDYALQEFIDYLEEDGYVKAYYEKQYQQLLARAEEDYLRMKSMYNLAQENSLKLRPSEVEKFERITNCMHDL